MRLVDHSVSLKALPVNALIGLEQTTRFTGGHDFIACAFELIDRGKLED